MTGLILKGKAQAVVQQLTDAAATYGNITLKEYLNIGGSNNEQARGIIRQSRGSLQTSQSQDETDCSKYDNKQH